MQHVKDTYAFDNAVRMFNNQDGGWASWVPTQNFVDMYEMNNGQTIDEEGSGYDPVHPFYNRDPRLYKTVIYPGMDFTSPAGVKRIFNTLDKKIGESANADFMDAATNASHTGLLWAKYILPIILKINCGSWYVGSVVSSWQEKVYVGQTCFAGRIQQESLWPKQL